MSNLGELFRLPWDPKWLDDPDAEMYFRWLFGTGEFADAIQQRMYCRSGLQEDVSIDTTDVFKLKSSVVMTLLTKCEFFNYLVALDKLHDTGRLQFSDDGGTFLVSKNRFHGYGMFLITFPGNDFALFGFVPSYDTLDELHTWIGKAMERAKDKNHSIHINAKSYVE